MNKFELLLLLLPVFLSGSCSRPSDSVGVGSIAPDFQGRDLTGKRVYLHSWSNKPVIVFFYATWCTSCHEEISAMVELRSKLTSEIGIVCIAIDSENIDKVRNTAAAYAINYPVVLDEDGIISSRYNVTRLPATFLIDSNGQVRYEFVGWDQENIEVLMEIINLSY